MGNRSRVTRPTAVEQMRVVVEYPPNYADIVAAIPAVAGMRPIFAWGQIIYNPHGVEIDPHLSAHEAMHGRQHYEIGGPQVWWDLYLRDAEFRVLQEVEAYGVQLQSYGTVTRDRERLHRYALALAGHLASPLYGGLMTPMDAYRRITGR